MFGLGFTEILLLVLIAFLVFGPKQFPVFMKNFVKVFNELRQVFTEVKTEFDFTKASAEEQLREIAKTSSKDLEFIKKLEKEIPPPAKSEFNRDSFDKKKK